MVRRQSISKYSKEMQNAKSLLDLSTEAQVLLGFLVLITDIRYRHQYGARIERIRKEGYGVSVQKVNKLLPDQAHSVDLDLEG